MIAVAIVDSGVNPLNPHVGGIVKGIALDADGRFHPDYLDRLGHGTAVAAAIHEKAPTARLFVVKIFESGLATNIEALIGAIEWATAERVRLVNLSVGTYRAEHAPRLRQAVDRAQAAGVTLVAAAPQEGVQWLPGALDGVVGVQLDWNVPRERCEVEEVGGRFLCRASGYPRTIPGVPPERNLRGLSFAVANVTGWLAGALAAAPDLSVDEVLRRHAVRRDGREPPAFRGRSA